MGVVGTWLESLDFQYKISEDCVRAKSKRSTCTKCYSICPEIGAIAITDRVPAIQPELCKQCGQCMAACPVQAVEGVFPKRPAQNGHLHARSHSIPSLTELLILHAKGIHSILPKEPLGEKWGERIEEANHILVAIEQEPLRVLSVDGREEGKEAKTLSRRELFTFFGKESKKLAKDVTPASWRFNHKDLELAPYYPNFQFNQIEVNAEKCTLCKTCEILCSKGCFRLNEEALSIASQSCSACQVCADSCPEQALTIKPEVTKAKTITLELHQNTCKTCRGIFNTLHKEKQKCPICTHTKLGYLSSRV